MILLGKSTGWQILFFIKFVSVYICYRITLSWTKAPTKIIDLVLTQEKYIIKRLRLARDQKRKPQKEERIDSSNIRIFLQSQRKVLSGYPENTKKPSEELIWIDRERINTSYLTLWDAIDDIIFVIWDAKYEWNKSTKCNVSNFRIISCHNFAYHILPSHSIKY